MSGGPRDHVVTPSGEVVYLSRQPAGWAPAITRETARDKQAKSIESRKRNRAEAENTWRMLAATARVTRAQLPGRNELASMAEAIVMQQAVAILSGDLKPRSAAEATNIARQWVEILRLEEGQATQIVETRDPGALMAKLEEFRQKAAERVGRSVPATAQEEGGP